MPDQDTFDFDLFVIGGGSGGVRAARIAAQTGARVAIAEEYRFGGTCVIRGCVPKKLMVFASSFGAVLEDAAPYGWSVGETAFDWPKFIAGKDAEIARLEAIYAENLRKAGAQLFDARATIVDPHTVRLATGAVYSAKHILVATGGKPVTPDIPGIEHGITSNEMFDLPELPRRVAIIGGGYIASEFAGILNGFGSKVLQIHRGRKLLRGFDADLQNHVETAMRERGIVIALQRDVTALEKEGEEIALTLDNGETHRADAVLFATGRAPNTAGLGLEEAGVRLGAGGAIEVDEWSQTAVPSIFAVGDVTGRAALTPVAIRDGHAFADTVFGGQPRKVDHSLIPTAVFTQPEIGAVGLTETEAREKGEVEIYRTAFRTMYNIFAGRQERMLMKLIVAKESRRVLGCHLVGPGVAEMIQLVAIPIRMGATKEDFDQTMAVHPTAAEELVTMRTAVA